VQIPPPPENEDFVGFGEAPAQANGVGVEEELFMQGGGAEEGQQASDFLDGFVEPAADAAPAAPEEPAEEVGAHGRVGAHGCNGCAWHQMPMLACTLACVWQECVWAGCAGGGGGCMRARLHATQCVLASVGAVAAPRLWEYRMSSCCSRRARTIVDVRASTQLPAPPLLLRSGPLQPHPPPHSHASQDPRVAWRRRNQQLLREKDEAEAKQREEQRASGAAHMKRINVR